MMINVAGIPSKGQTHLEQCEVVCLAGNEVAVVANECCCGYPPPRSLKRRFVKMRQCCLIQLCCNNRELCLEWSFPGYRVKGKGDRCNCAYMRRNSPQFAEVYVTMSVITNRT